MDENQIFSHVLEEVCFDIVMEVQREEVIENGENFPPNSRLLTLEPPKPSRRKGGVVRCEDCGTSISSKYFASHLVKCLTSSFLAEEKVNSTSSSSSSSSKKVEKKEEVMVQRNKLMRTRERGVVNYEVPDEFGNLKYKRRREASNQGEGGSSGGKKKARFSPPFRSLMTSTLKKCLGPSHLVLLLPSSVQVTSSSFVVVFMC